MRYFPLHYRCIIQCLLSRCSIGLNQSSNTQFDTPKISHHHYQHIGEIS